MSDRKEVIKNSLKAYIKDGNTSELIKTVTSVIDQKVQQKKEEIKKSISVFGKDNE